MLPFAPRAALLLLALIAAPAAAQRPPPPPTWVGDAAALGVNSLLGGLTAGVMQEMRGGSFQDGFARGMLGGAVIYGGKRLAVQRFGAAGLVGREVAAVGTSIVRNAADARPSLERVVLPIGPVRLYLGTGAAPRFRAKLDLATLVAAGYAVSRPQLEWDAAESLSSGSLVFRVEDLLIRGHGGDEEIGATGIARAGTIYVSDLVALDFAQDVRHERVHVLQHDQLFLTWSDPAEDWALNRLPGGGRVNEYVDLNLSPLVLAGLREAFKNYYQRPWELEARYLAER